MTLFKHDTDNDKFEEYKKFEDHGLPVRDISFSKDDTHIVSVSNDLHINLTDVETLKLVQSCTEHEDEIVCCSFHPNDEVFVTGSADNKIKVWDTKSRKCVNTLETHDDTVWSVRFSPDGKYLISGSEEGVFAISEFK